MSKIKKQVRSFRFIIYFSLFTYVGVFGQDKLTKSDAQVWFQYFQNARLNEKWSANFDAGYRRTDQFVNKPLQWLVRGGMSYHVNKDIVISGGYAYFSLHTITSKNEFDRSEHRPWLRCTFTQKFNKWQIQHRYRYELRNIQNNNLDEVLDTYNSFSRIAYQFNLQYILKGEKVQKGVSFIHAFNEVFVNFGSKISSNFDQNRVYAGVGYGISDNLNASLGYQFIYTQQNTINFTELNTVRLNLIQNLDLRKPKIETDENKKIN